jgi:MFS family permease
MSAVPAAGRPASPPSLLRRSPGFARLAASEVISPLGDAMGTVALVLHLQRVEGTGTAVATVLIAESLPPLLSPWLGALADRFAGRRLLVVCAVAQAAVVVALALWLPGIPGLFALALLRATFAGVAAPAVGASVPALVDDDDLQAANSLLGGGRELGTIFGPAMAGVLFAWAGVRWVLAVDAATFLLALPLLVALPLPWAGRGVDGAGDAEEPTTTVRADARAGMRQLWGSPVLRALAIGFWLTVLASASDDLILVFLASDSLGAGPAGTGLLLAGASVGLVVGLLALARWGRRIPALTAVLVGFAVTSLGNLLTSAAPVLAVAFATQALRGGGIALLEANIRTFVQRNVPRPMLGRVLANLYGGVGVAAAAGYVIGGPLLDATSPRTMFVLIGTAGLLASAVAALLVRRRDEGAP